MKFKYFVTFFVASDIFGLRYKAEFLFRMIEWVFLFVFFTLFPIFIDQFIHLSKGRRKLVLVIFLYQGF